MSAFLTKMWSLLYFMLGVGVIFFISYLMGHAILDGGALIGNDSTFALSLVYWFDRFFPEIPLWYPLQGTGVSLFHSYPMGTTFLILILKHLTNLSSVEAFRILSFLTFPLTALGIYFLAWIRLKNQTIAAIAGVFFLLSQASWLFQTLHGIFAQSFSLIFVAPTFLFFDLSLEQILKNGQKNQFLLRLYFVLTVFLLGLAYLAHPVTGTILVIALFILSVVRFILNSPKFTPKILIGRIFKGVVIAAIVMILAQALMAFWLMPFASYSALSNREGLSERNLTQLQEESLRIPQLLGLGSFGEEDYRYDYFFFATPVLIFFAIGTIMSFILKKKLIQTFALLGLIFVLLTTVPIYLPFLASMFQFFFTAVYFRDLPPAFILLPIVAAFGVWVIPEVILLKPFDALTTKIKGAVVKNLLFVVVSILALGITIWSIKNLAHKPPPNTDPKIIRKYDFQAYGPSLSNDFEKFIKTPNPFLKWPKVIVSKNGLEGAVAWQDSLTRALNIKNDKEAIVDVSPYAVGGIIMQGAGIESDIRYVNLYHYFASLTHSMWGYEQGVFYGENPLYKNPNLLADLALWFGIKYSVLVPGYDPFEKYEAAGWEPSEKVEKFQGSKFIPWDALKIWENPKPTGLYTLSTKPVVLVVNDFKKGAYEQVFRSANLGALGYEDAWLVEGKKNIDDYSLEELLSFDGIILHGYSYKSKGNAWGRLKEYLEKGGRVFVDTGWQYVDKDWWGDLPEVLPVSKTHWDNIGTSWQGVEIDGESTKDIDLGKFEPPIWNNTPWGMALAKKDNLREDAKPILWKEDKILMASRNVGRGKIVWSGINIFSHLTGATKKTMNEEEARFLGKILKPLFSRPSQDLQQITYKRDFPDKVDFIFNKSIENPFWLLFRESFSTNWQANLISNRGETRLSIYRAGPGFMLIKVSEVNSGDTLKLEYSLGFKDGFLAKLISITTLVFLIVYLPFGERFKIQFRLPKPTFIKKSLAEEEEEY